MIKASGRFVRGLFVFFPKTDKNKYDPKTNFFFKYFCMDNTKIYYFCIIIIKQKK